MIPKIGNDNNVNFNARMKYYGDSKRWKGLVPQFEKVTKGIDDNKLMLEVFEMPNGALSIAKNNKYGYQEFYLHLNKAVSERLLKLKDKTIVDKLKKILEIDNLKANNYKILKESEELAKKFNLKGRALETFNNAINMHVQNDIGEYFKNDIILGSAEFKV